MNTFSTWYLTSDSHVSFCVVTWLPHTGATRAALWFRLREMADNKECPSLQKVVPAIRWLPHSLCATLCHCCGTMAHFATLTVCASHLGKFWLGTCIDSGHRSNVCTHRVDVSWKCYVAHTRYLYMTHTSNVVQCVRQTPLCVKCWQHYKAQAKSETQHIWRTQNT